MIHIIGNISEMHRLLRLPKPKHPLISIIDLKTINSSANKEIWRHHTTKFYSISLKNEITGKIKYGQNTFDFDEGVLSCFSPNQVLSVEGINENDVRGYSLLFSPDFLLNHPLTKKIKQYQFFSYELKEALFLSDNEEKAIIQIFKTIETEYSNNIDAYSQEVILSNIDLLLIYINRYYNRQFLTRKNYHLDILSRVEQILTDYYQDEEIDSLPTVQYLANEVHLSAPYLSDMLKNYTGLSAQQHIHESIIYKAKELLTISELSINQIAYELGFQYPQSFHKLFKRKTNITPSKFRQLYN